MTAHMNGVRLREPILRTTMTEDRPSSRSSLEADGNIYGVIGCLGAGRAE